MNDQPEDARSARRSRRQPWVPIAMLLLLQAMMSVPLPMSLKAWATSSLQPSLDLLGMLFLAGLATAAGRARLGASVAGLALWVAIVLRPAIALFPRIFQRPFELGDVLQLPGLVHLLMGDATLWTKLLALLAVIAIWPVSAIAAHQLVKTVRSRDFVAGGGVAAAWLLIGALSSLGWQPSTLFAVGECTIAAVRTALGLDERVQRMHADIDAGIARMASAPAGLAGLRGVDVHVLVVESYGDIAWRHPELAPRMRRLWTDLEGELRANAFAMVSGCVQPAITGGGSWMAHQELFTAIRVPDQRTWEHVLKSEGRRLPGLFAAAGWHTVEVMPAMPYHWPVGAAFYGFAQSLVKPDIPYAGHPYAFGHMPDQVALLHLLDHVVRPAQRPLFTTFVSVSSHAPWPEIPRYVGDWRPTAADFAQPAIVHPVSWTDLPSGEPLLPAYADSLDYALRTAVGYVARLPRPSLVLLLGDHQPPLSAVDVACPEDRRLDVPVHVISNRPNLLAPWREDGFVPGNDPRAAAGTWPLYELAPRLLRHYMQVR